jgi:hypothetical protein
MSEEERLAARAKEVQEAGEARFGKETFGLMVGAIARAGATPQQVAATLASPDALSQFQHFGKEALLKAAADGDRDCEKAYERIRSAERERHWENSSSAYRKLSPNAGQR